MAHPFAEHRQHKVERSRAAKMTGVGAEAKHSDAGADRKLIKSMVKPNALKMEGSAPGARLDKYARGGKVKKAQTNVNVIIAPQGGGGAAPPVLPPTGMPPALPASPAPSPGAGMPPVPQRRGGRAYAAGGSVKDGPAWKEGLDNGTKVQNSPGKNDTGDIHRPKQITYATGGPVEANRMGPAMTAGAESGEGRLQKTAMQRRKG